MILSPLYFKVYSLVEGYWDLWVVRGAAVPAFRFFFFPAFRFGLFRVQRRRGMACA